MTVDKCFWVEVLEKIVNAGHKSPKWLDKCSKCNGYQTPCDEYYNPQPPISDEWNKYMNGRFGDTNNGGETR